MSHFTPQVVTSQHCWQLIVVWKLIIALNHFLYPMSCRRCFHARANSRDTNHVQWIISLLHAVAQRGWAGRGPVSLCLSARLYLHFHVFPFTLLTCTCKQTSYTSYFFDAYSMHYHRYCTVPAISASVCARVCVCCLSISKQHTRCNGKCRSQSIFCLLHKFLNTASMDSAFNLQLAVAALFHLNAFYF